MLLRLCQLKSLLILLLVIVSSCAFLTSDDKDASELLTPMKNEWFQINQEHALQDQLGRPQPHHFFDLNPDLGKTDILINAVILTPEGSVHGYHLDLSSGQRYYAQSFCSQRDIWGQYSGTIGRPTYSIGVIPRMLDQLGDPQKVIIFGGTSKFQKLTDTHEHRIKLVGALIEETCPVGNCLGRDNWISRMVFVAVDPADSKYKEVSNISELQRIVNWPEAKAVLENLDGRNGGGRTSYPVTRVGKLILLKDAIDFYRKRSIFLSIEETKKISKGCHSLYHKLWTDVGDEHPEDRPARNVEELNTKLKLIENLKLKRKPVGIANRFKTFIKKYYSDFNTCQKFVYAGNVNFNKEEFWFLNYVGIFLRLHNEGHFFDCKRHTWQKNVEDSEGNRVYDIKIGISDCKERDFDFAMEYLPNYLKSLTTSEASFYKFVDYDNHPFGTHQKLYSWVKVSSRKFDCKTDPNEQTKKNLKAFPDDVSWKKWNVNDIEDEMKIIY